MSATMAMAAAPVTAINIHISVITLSHILVAFDYLM
jgi:hypothetical protein